MLGVEVPGEAIAAVLGLLTAMGMGLGAWGLVTIVRLTQLVAKLEEAVSSLTDRVRELEHAGA